MNNYRSIKIRNPISSQQLVRLKQNQCIEMHLDKKLFPNVNFEYNDVFFELTCDKNYYLFKPKKFIEEWSNYSSMHLGSIFVNSNFNSSNIIVLSESSNNLKSNFLTIINPKNDIVRMIPGDILEVILFDCENQELEWHFSECMNCEIEFLGESRLSSKKDKIFPCKDYPYAQLPRFVEFKELPIVQRHFWFRFNKKLMNLLNDTVCSPKHFGNMIFINQKNQTEFSMSLYVTLHKKYKTRVLNSLLLSKLNEAYSLTSFKNEYNFDETNLINEVHVSLIKSKKIEDGCGLRSILPRQNNFHIMNQPCGNFDEECI